MHLPLFMKKNLNTRTTRLHKTVPYSSGKHVREMYTPLNPTFYIEKLGYAGVYLFYLFLL